MGLGRSDYSLSVKRNAKPPTSWRWEINCAGRSLPVEKSSIHIKRARCTRARADQGIFRALVKKTNTRGIEALFVDFEICTRKGLRRQNLHGELDGVSRAFKSPVTERFAFRPRGPGGEQLGFVIVVECNHFLIQLWGNTSCRCTPGTSGQTLVLRANSLYTVKPNRRKSLKNVRWPALRT